LQRPEGQKLEMGYACRAEFAATTHSLILSRTGGAAAFRNLEKDQE
jgi:hypothetical protein